MNLEQIIRPFQTKDITPPRSVTPGNRKDQIPLHIQFGAGGEKVFIYSTFAGPSVSTGSDYQEVSRETTEKKITSKTDPSQFVTVKNTTTLFARSKSDPNVRLNIYFKDQG